MNKNSTNDIQIINNSKKLPSNFSLDIDNLIKEAYKSLVMQGKIQKK